MHEASHNFTILLDNLIKKGLSFSFDYSYIDKADTIIINPVTDGDESKEYTLEMFKIISAKTSGLSFKPVNIIESDEIAKINDLTKHLTSLSGFFSCNAISEIVVQNPVPCLSDETGIDISSDSVKFSATENDITVGPSGNTDTYASSGTINKNIPVNDSSNKLYSDDYDYITSYEEYNKMTPKVITELKAQTGYDVKQDKYLEDLWTDRAYNFTSYSSYTERYPEMQRIDNPHFWCESYEDMCNHSKAYAVDNPVLDKGILSFDSFIRAKHNRDIPCEDSVRSKIDSLYIS